MVGQVCCIGCRSVAAGGGGGGAGVCNDGGRAGSLDFWFSQLSYGMRPNPNWVYNTPSAIPATNVNMAWH